MYKPGSKRLSVVDGRNAGGRGNDPGDRGTCGHRASGHAALEPGVQAGPEVVGEQESQLGERCRVKTSLETSLRCAAFKGESEDKKLARAWEPGSTESRERRVLSSKWPPLMRKDKGRHASVGFGNRENGLSKKGQRLPWQELLARSKAGNVCPCSEECVGGEAGGRPTRRPASTPGFQPCGGGAIRRQPQGNANGPVMGVLFGFFAKDERDSEYV